MPGPAVLTPRAGQAAARPPELVRLLLTPLTSPLLGERLSLDFYARNGFRFLSLPAWADPNTVASRWQQYRSLLRLNEARARGGAIRTIREDHLDAEAVEACVARLENPRHRFLAELFWLHLTEGDFQKVRQEGALGTPGVIRTLAPDGLSGAPRLHRLHALAVASHCLAIERELDFLERRGAPPAGVWEDALRRWRDLCADDAFWKYLQTRVEKLDDPRLLKEDVAKARGELGAVALAFHETLAEKYATSGDFAQCVRHLRLIRESGFPQASVLAATWSALKKVGGARLADLTRRAQEAFDGLQARVQRGEFDNLAAPFLREAREVHELLARQLEVPDDYLAQSGAFDPLAEVIHTASNTKISYEGDQRERNLLYTGLLNTRILKLPLSSATRMKVEVSVNEDGRILYSRFGLDAAACPDPKKCFFVETAEADPEESIVLPIHRVTGRQVNVDHYRGSGGVQVSYESTRILVPRSKAASATRRGALAELATPESEYTPRQREAAAELCELEDLQKGALAALKRERDAAIAAEETRRDSALQSLRKRHQARKIEAEAGIARERRNEEGAISAEKQRHRGDRAQVEAAHAPGVAGARQNQAQTEARLSGFPGFLRTTLPFWAVSSCVLWLGIPDLGWFAAAIGLVIGWPAAARVRNIFTGRRDKELAAAERVLTAALAECDKASETKKREIEQTHARNRKPSEDAIAAIGREEKALTDGAQKRIETLRNDCERRLKEAKASSEQRIGKVRSEIVKQVPVKDLSTKWEFPACQAARKKGFSEGAEPSSYEMQMTEAEKTEARVRLMLHR